MTHAHVKRLGLALLIAATALAGCGSVHRHDAQGSSDAGASSGFARSLATAARTTTTTDARASSGGSTAIAAGPGSGQATGSAGAGSGSATGTGGDATSTTTLAAGSNSSKYALAPTQPGTYDERQQGSFSFSGGTYQDPPQGTLVVGSPSASGTEVWKSYVQQNQQPQDTNIQFRENGPFLISNTEATPQGNVTCTFNPAIPAPTWPPKVGDAFSSTGNCGSFTVDVKGRISGTRNVVLGGKTYLTWVVDSTLSSHGQVNATGTQEDWYSPALRLPLYQYSQISGTYGVFSFKSELKSWLESAKPA